MRSAYHGGRADSRIVGRMLIGMVLLSVGTPVRRSDCQSPRAANPERPTVATHAYAVAPGYWELEQGFRAYGFGRLSEGRAWDFNLKIGLRNHVQLGIAGTGLAWTDGVSGIVDLGLALKLRTGLGERGALDRKSTRLNSSHGYISYAVFCLKKKKKDENNRYGVMRV